MTRAIEREFVEISVNNIDLHKQLNLCVSSNQIVQDVLEIASAHLCAPGRRSSLQIRREGEILSLDPEALVGEALRAGDRLILEVAVGTGRLGSDRAAPVEEDGFRAAASREAGRAISADSATFLDRAQNPFGE
jgi:hypothetical protein